MPVLLETTCAPGLDAPLNHVLTHLPLYTIFSPFLPSNSFKSILLTQHQYSRTMRMSCNGCRVLRKGCSENCSIRPCLHWIKTADSQAHATLFLAKFYGRAGLVNLINAAPQHLRPAVFRSLLYEACGRMVNPVYGSVGLLWTNSWQLCQEAVEAVLRGQPITQISSVEINAKACDIRHVSKDDNSAASDQLHKVSKPRTHFKRTSHKVKAKAEPVYDFMTELGSSSHESVVSRNLSSGVDGLEVDSVSAETVEASLGNMGDDAGDASDVELELTLGFK